VDNIKTDLRELGLGNIDWIDLAQDREQWRALVNTAMNLRVIQYKKLLKDNSASRTQNYH
jgi:hypothetical protein